MNILFIRIDDIEIIKFSDCHLNGCVSETDKPIVVWVEKHPVP